MKVLACGTRHWIEQQPVMDVLSLFPVDTVIVHGGARGADNIAGFAAKILGLPVRAYPVDHSLDGPWPAAGILRNIRMLASENPYEPDGSHVDLGLAFTLTDELTSGTAHMVKNLTLAEIPFLKIMYRKSTWPKTLESLKKEILKWS